MRRTSNSERSKELAESVRWALTLIAVLEEEQGPSSFYASLRTAIEQARNSGDLRGIRLMQRDLVDGARALTPATQSRIDSELKLRLGQGLADKNIEIAAEVAEILRRGRVRDDDECRLLVAFLDCLADSRGSTKSKAKARSMIEAFERSR